MAKKPDKNQTPVIENRKARHDYAIGETLEVGIVLLGTEVKSVRAGNANLQGAYVRASAEPPVLELIGVHIGEYLPAGTGPLQHSPLRRRRLLAHAREIRKLALKAEAKGTTLVPLKIYFKEGWAKVLIGVGTGKSRSDKRDDIKKREAGREISRVMSRRV